MCFLKYFISKWQLRSKNSIALSSPSVIMKHYYDKDHRCMLIRINELMNNGHLVREPATLNSCVPVVQHIIEGLSC